MTMSRIEKLLKRMLSKPKDFTYDELRQILNYYGFKENNKGKTSGSRVEFIGPNKETFRIHKPHPGNVLKEYQVKDISKFLIEWRFFKWKM